MSNFVKIILIISAVIILLFLVIALPNYIKAPGHPPLITPENPSISYLIEKLNYLDNAWWEWTDNQIITRSSDPEMIDALKEATESDDPWRSTHAIYLLFRLRDDPEVRLQELFQRLENHEAVHVIRVIFLARFNYEDYIYLSEFERLLAETEDPLVAQNLQEAINNIKGTSTPDGVD